MAKKKVTEENDRKRPIPQSEDVLDSYESWLQRQPLKDVRAKSGFVGTAIIEVDS